MTRHVSRTLHSRYNRVSLISDAEEPDQIKEFYPLDLLKK